MNDNEKAVINTVINTKTKTKLKPRYICLSGAGIYGISFLGVLSEVDLSNIEVLIGSSAGGVIVALLNIGYTPQEVYKIVHSLNLSEYQNMSIDNLLRNYGFDNMSRIHKFFIAVLKQKINNPSNITFKELYEKTNQTLILTGSCVNKGKTEYFSHKTTPNMPIITAMKITMAFIGIFAPIKYDGFYYCDGAYFDFFPIKYITDNYELNTQKGGEILGLTIKTCDYYLDKMDSLMDYMYGLYIGLSKNYCDHMSYTDNEKLKMASNINFEYNKKNGNNNGNNNNGNNNNKNKNNTSIIDQKVNGHIIYIYIDIKSSSNSMNLSVNDDNKKKIYELGREHYLKYFFNEVS